MAGYWSVPGVETKKVRGRKEIWKRKEGGMYWLAKREERTGWIIMSH